VVVGAAGDQLVAALGQRGADCNRVGADLPQAAPSRPSAAGRRASAADAGGTAPGMPGMRCMAAPLPWVRSRVRPAYAAGTDHAGRPWRMLHECERQGVGRRTCFAYALNSGEAAYLSATASAAICACAARSARASRTCRTCASARREQPALPSARRRCAWVPSAAPLLPVACVLGCLGIRADTAATPLRVARALGWRARGRAASRARLVVVRAALQRREYAEVDAVLEVVRRVLLLRLVAPRTLGALRRARRALSVARQALRPCPTCAEALRQRTLPLPQRSSLRLLFPD